MTTWYSQFIGLFLTAVCISIILYIFMYTITELLSEIRNIIRVSRYERGEKNARY